MKKRELIKILTKEGCELLRHGSNHDIYIDPQQTKENLFLATGKLMKILPKRS